MKHIIPLCFAFVAWTSACVEIPTTASSEPEPQWLVVHADELMPVTHLAPGAVVPVLIMDRSGAKASSLPVTSTDATVTIERSGEQLRLTGARIGQTTLKLGDRQTWPLTVQEMKGFALLWPGIARRFEMYPSIVTSADSTSALLVGLADALTEPDPLPAFVWGPLDVDEVQDVDSAMTIPYTREGQRLSISLEEGRRFDILVKVKDETLSSPTLQKGPPRLLNRLSLVMDGEGAWVINTQDGSSLHHGPLPNLSLQSDCARLVTSGPYLGYLPASADIARVQRTGDPRPNEPPCPFTVSAPVPGAQAPVTAQGMLPARVSAQR